MGNRRAEPPPEQWPFQESKHGRTLEIRVTPRASVRCIDRVEAGVLRVKLTAPPADGEANTQLIELLAKTLKVPKSTITIIRGTTNRHKTVEIASEEE